MHACERGPKLFRKYTMSALIDAACAVTTSREELAWLIESLPTNPMGLKKQCIGCGNWVMEECSACDFSSLHHMHGADLMLLASGEKALAIRYPNSPLSRASLHGKEKCHGCGLWKEKLYACSHCEMRPNRAQAQYGLLTRPASASALDVSRARSVREHERSMSSVQLHSKERCQACGLWKFKQLQCSHCASRPNRMQAAVTSMLKGPFHLPGETASIERIERGLLSAEATGRRPSLTPQHDKERCKGCGLWKDKVRACSFCVTRPNRQQAWTAMAKQSATRPTFVDTTRQGAGGGGGGAPPSPSATRASTARGGRTGNRRVTFASPSQRKHMPSRAPVARQEPHEVPPEWQPHEVLVPVPVHKERCPRCNQTVKLFTEWGEEIRLSCQCSVVR